MRYIQNVLVILFLIVLYPFSVEILGAVTPPDKPGLHLSTFTGFVIVPVIVAYLMYLYVDKVDNSEAKDT